MASNARITRRSIANVSTVQPDMTALTNLDRLILAQAVYELGANAWSAVSKLLTKHPLLQQPKSFFTPQSCQAMYLRLMKEAELDLSLSTEPSYAVHAPSNLKLAQRHYQARMLELRELITLEETNFKQIVSEIEELRSGRWDDKVRAKLTGAPFPEGTSAAGTSSIPKHTAEGAVAPADELSSSDLSGITDSASPRSQARENALKRKKSIQVFEQVPDSEQDVENLSDQKKTALEHQNSPTDEELVNETSSGPPSGVQSVRTVTPETSQGKEHAEDGGSDDDDEPPHYTRRTPRRRLSSVPVARVTVHARGNKNRHSFAPSRHSGELVSARHQSIPSEGRESPKSDANRISDTFNDDGNALAEISRDEGKRKASLTEGMEWLRDKKRVREQSEPADEEDTGLVTRRRDRPLAPGDQAAFRRFQSVVNLIHSQISQHRNGNIFHHPIKRSDAPDYHEIVKRPMDLKTIKARVRDGLISSAIEFQRDVFLMFANAMMYNRPGSDIHQMAEEMMLESENHINTLRTTEMTHRI